MAKKILFGVVAVFALFALVTAFQPAGYRISRTASIAAPPAVAYAQVADFHQWERWSPWAKLDAAMKTTYEGQPGAVGSSYYWTGNDKVGEGRMTVTSVAPAQSVAIKLEFLRPFAATNATQFAFAPEGAGTRVTWNMDGNKGGFVGKAFGLFMDFDKLVGGDFEKGLTQLKAVSEAEAQKAEAARMAQQAAAAAAVQPAPAAGGAIQATAPAPVK